MTLEQAFFIQALAAYIQGKSDIRVPGGWEGLDWSQLLRYAKTQNLAGIFYVQCRDKLSQIPSLQSTLTELQSGFVAEAVHSIALQRDFAQLEQHLTEAEISFLPFKGSVLSQYYPTPQLRTMGDIDFLIHGSDRLRCHQQMCSLGYTPAADPGAVWTYSDGVVTYEIHSHMLYESLANQVNHQDYFDEAWKYAHPLLDTSRYQIDENFHFVFLMVHTAKHIINKGCGLRPFLDMVFFTRAQGRNMNWVWITQQLEKLELLTFTQTCFSLCEKWFGVTMPISSCPLDETFYLSATRKVFEDGIFGHINQQNVTASVVKQIHRSSRPRILVLLGNTWKKIFPPYWDMRQIPWYSFVDGKPYLMPVAWIYRFFYCLFRKPKAAAENLTSPYAQRDEMTAREEFITSWGL